MKIDKNSWHYRVRLQWQDFVSLNAGREINLDKLKTTKTQYVIDVVLGYYLTLLSPIIELIIWIFKKTKILNPVLNILYKIKNRKKDYIKYGE